MRNFNFIAIIILLTAYQSIGQSFEFIQNKGQWDGAVTFKGELNNGAIFMQNNGYRMLQYDAKDFDKVKSTMTGHDLHDDITTATRGQGKAITGKTNNDINMASHAYDVVFKNGNPKSKITTERAFNGYYNYFIGNDSSKWASEVKSYGTIVYNNIYPGIDARFYSENGYVKYDIIVHPNASLAPLAIEYNGVQKLELSGGKLKVQTSVSTVTEAEPYSYQLVDGVKKEVSCRYELTGNRVKYKLSGYDPTKTLVIDPTLIFSTFTGSPSSNWGYTATYDAQGNAYGGGIAFAAGYPTTTGAFQTSFAGGTNSGEGSGFDIAIMKFNPTATQRIYATYLGGSNGNEQPHSLVTDAAGNLVIAGRTSSANFPTTRNLIGPGGSWDIIVSNRNPAP